MTTTETNFRILQLSKQLLTGFRQRRDELDLTNELAMTAIVERRIEDLTTQLVKLGFGPEPEDKTKARLPIADSTLEKLRESSSKTNLPATTLMILALSAELEESKPAPRKRTTKKATAKRRTAKRKATKRTAKKRGAK